MNLPKAVKLRILELCNKHKLTANRLAILSGITPSTLNSIVDETSKNPKLLTILHICFGLNIDLRDFFDSNLFTNLDDE